MRLPWFLLLRREKKRKQKEELKQRVAEAAGAEASSSAVAPPKEKKKRTSSTPAEVAAAVAEANEAARLLAEGRPKIVEGSSSSEEEEEEAATVMPKRGAAAPKATPKPTPTPSVADEEKLYEVGDPALDEAPLLEVGSAGGVSLPDLQDFPADRIEVHKGKGKSAFYNLSACPGRPCFVIPDYPVVDLRIMTGKDYSYLKVVIQLPQEAAQVFNAIDTKAGRSFQTHLKLRWDRQLRLAPHVHLTVKIPLLAKGNNNPAELTRIYKDRRASPTEEVAADKDKMEAWVEEKIKKYEYLSIHAVVELTSVKIDDGVACLAMPTVTAAEFTVLAAKPEGLIPVVARASGPSQSNGGMQTLMSRRR